MDESYGNPYDSERTGPLVTFSGAVFGAIRKKPTAPSLKVAVAGRVNPTA